MRYFLTLGDAGRGYAEVDDITGIVQRVYVEWKDGTSGTLTTPPGQTGQYTIHTLRDAVRNMGLPFEADPAPPA